MDLMKLAGTLLSSDSLGGLSEATGSSDNDVSNVLVKALPALLSGANDQAKNKKTSSSFASALSDHAKDDTSNLSSFLSNVDMDDGAKILTHLLGSGEEDTVEEIAEESGLDTADVLKILSAAAPLLLSLLGQQTEEEDKKEAVGDLVGVLLENVDVGSVLTNLLTSNNSGKGTKKASSSKKSSSGTTKKTTAKKSSSSSTKKTSSGTAKKSASSSTKKSTSTAKKKAASTKTSTKKKAASTKTSTKKKAASDNSTVDLVGGILKNLLK